jgi:hypothetical protein
LLINNSFLGDLETLAEKDNNTNRTRVDTTQVDKEVNTRIITSHEVETIIITEEAAEVETEVVEVVTTKEVAICNKCLMPTNSTHNNSKLSNNQVLVKAIPRCSSKMFRGPTILSNSNR